MASSVRLVDGTFDFSGGVDSGRVPVVQSASNPNGLPRSNLAWLNNATVRGGAINGRMGWKRLCKVVPGPTTKPYQSGFLYDPTGVTGSVTALPYLMLSIGGSIYQVRVDTDNSVVNLGGANPAGITQGFMAQAEQFLVVQAGDFGTVATPTLPLFWDGLTLRRSLGIVPAPGTIGQHTFTISATWVIPAVGNTVVVNLVGNYNGAVGDVGQYSRVSVGNVVGVFQVTNIGANTMTLKTVSSPYIGATISLGGPDQLVVSSNVNTPTSELPAAGPMVYYLGRLWYAQGRTYIAGDIVDGPSGTAPYSFRDSVLKITENPLALGGDGFTVPNSAGNITALFYTANLDTTLGQGPLFVGTRKQIYQLVAPVTRTAWIASNQNNQPIQTVAQQRWGPVSDRGVFHVNGDAFYETLEVAIRSLVMAQRQYSQWGNLPISRAETRVLRFNNKLLMGTTPGILFDNRALVGVLPVVTPVGVAFQAIAPLDFDIISSFGHEVQTADKPPPAWEGMWEGLDILQLFEGDFNGLQRAFAIVHARNDGSIEVWELTGEERFDNGDNRIQWQVEFPAYEFGRVFDMKDLAGLEVWVDRIAGQIDVKVEYRVDADPCWQFWAETQFCAARSTCEDVQNPVCYPVSPYCDGYKFPLTFGVPPQGQCESLQKRPTTRGYTFQVRLTVKGAARIRGILLYANPVERMVFEGLSC